MRDEAPGGTPVETSDASGTVWRRVWSLADRLVVQFVGIATAEVRDPADTVVFDRELPLALERHLAFDQVLPLTLSRRGELVLHAGLISRAGSTVVLLGSSGAGKSTLVAYCGQLGWTIGGDDGVVLEPGPPWAARPTHSGLRLTGASLDLLGLPAAGHAESAGKWETATDGQPPRLRDSAPIAAVLVLDPAPEAVPAEVSPLHGVEAHVELFRGLFHTDIGDAAALSRIVGQLADIAESVPIGRLTVGRGREALASAERLLRHLVPGST